MDGAPALLYYPKPYCKLLVSYPQQWYTGINVNHWCVIKIAIHKFVAFCIFSWKISKYFYKLLAITVICNGKQTNIP